MIAVSSAADAVVGEVSLVKPETLVYFHISDPR